MANSINDMIIRFRTEGSEKTQADLNKINSQMEKTKESGEKGADGVASLTAGFKKVGTAIAGVVAVMGSLKMAMKGFQSIIETAGQFEAFENRLTSLYGSAEKASQAFEKFREVASKTPATLSEVVQAGTQLKAFGMDAENLIQTASDLSAFMGVDIVEASEAMGRAFSAGYGASIILRQRGIVELIRSFQGIEDLSKLTLPEFREAMLKTFQDPASGIAGSAERLSKTYQGAIFNIQDSWEVLKASLGEVMLPNITPMINQLSALIEDMTPTLQPLMAELSSLAQTIAPLVVNAFINISQAIAQILPPIVGILSTLTPLIDGIIKIITALSPLLTSISEIIELTMNAFMPIIQQILYDLSPVIEMIGNLVKVILDGLSPAITEIMKIVKNVVDIVMSLVSPTLEFVIEGVTELANLIMQILSPALESIYGLVNLILEPLAKLFTSVMGVKSVSEQTIEPLDKMTRALNELNDEQSKSIAKFDQMAQLLLNEKIAIDKGYGSQQNMSRLIGIMNQQYGAYIGNIKLETLSYKELTNQLNVARKSLENYWSAKYVITQQEQLLSKLTELKAKLADFAKTPTIREWAKKNTITLDDILDPEFLQKWEKATSSLSLYFPENRRPISQEPWKSALQTFYEAKKLSDQLQKNMKQYEKALLDLDKTSQKTSITPSIKTDTVAKDADKLKDTFKYTYEDILDMENDFLNTILEMQGKSLYSIIMEQKSKINEILYNIDEGVSNLILSEEEAIEIRERLYEDFGIFLELKQKEINNKTNELMKQSATDEIEIIRSKYDDQRKVIIDYINEIETILAEPKLIEIGLDEEQLKLNIAMLNAHLEKLNEAEKAEINEYEKTILSDRAQAYIDHCQDMLLNQEQYLSQKNILINAEIEQLKKLGLTEEELVQIQKSLQQEAFTDYQNYVKEMWEKQLGDAKDFVDLIQGLNEEFIDSMIDTFVDVARENKNFWDAMLEMIEDFVINAIKEINKYIAKLLITKAIEAMLGVPSAPIPGAGTGAGTTYPIGYGGFYTSVAPSTPTYIPVSPPQNNIMLLGKKLDRLADAIENNQPVVYTQLIEGIPLRNAIKKANIKANVL